MKNLLNFIYKYAHFLSFLLLEVLCFVLLILNNNYHQSSFLSSANSSIGYIYEKWTNTARYLTLNIENDSLIIENQILRNTLELYRKDFIPNINNVRYNYIAARIVGTSVSKSQNYITLNKGKKHGVKQDMGVISNKGVVGIIYKVSNNYSTVIPIINTNFRISGKIKKNNFFGSVLWDGKNPKIVQLNEIPGYVNIKTNDTIVTSGFSAVFPENILIGKIHSFNKNPATQFYNIDVELFNDFRNINHVYIINSLNYEEQVKLEQETYDN
jgi:rod shape-determining protein MreC